MENTNNLYLIGHKHIEDSEWKPSQNGSSQLFVNNWKSVRIINYSRKRVVDRLHEFQIEVPALVRIPFAGLGEFGIRLRIKTKNHVLST